jgi:hypothetical protein
VIRKHRPQILFAPWYDLPIGRGWATTTTSRPASSCPRATTSPTCERCRSKGEPWQARAIFYYFLPAGLAPTFLVDVSPSTRTGGAHRGPPDPVLQLREAGASTGPASILDWFEVYARKDASQIGARYAQAYYSAAALKVGDPMMLVKDVVPRPDPRHPSRFLTGVSRLDALTARSARVYRVGAGKSRWILIFAASISLNVRKEVRCGCPPHTDLSPLRISPPRCTFVFQHPRFL